MVYKSLTILMTIVHKKATVYNFEQT